MKDVQLVPAGPPGDARLPQASGAVEGRAALGLRRTFTTAIETVAATLAADFANLFLPSDCRVCAAPLVALSKVGVCEACIARVARLAAAPDTLCSRCGDALGMESARFAAALGVTECTLCRLAPPEFARAVAFADYDAEMREMLHLLKFEGMRSIAEHLLGRSMAEAALRLRAAAADDLLVLPVPLFAARERERGYNQAHLLAAAAVKRLRRLDPTWRLRLDPGVLSRVKDTRALYRLSPTQRRNDLRGAFRVVAPERLRNREVLLVDDIMTTGATARECARVLLRAGAAKVWVLTAAKAQPENVSALNPLKDVAMWTAQAPSTPPMPRATILQPDTQRQQRF